MAGVPILQAVERVAHPWEVLIMPALHVKG